MNRNLALDSAGAPALHEREAALLHSVVYASIFSYPLTAEEVCYCAPSRLDPGQVSRILRESPRLRRLIEEGGGYFYPSGRRAWVRLRRLRERHSLRILRRNRRALQLIAALPATRLVALSGSIAHLNNSRGGDVDLFLVTRGARVWSVAVATLLLARLFRRRREICFNYLLSDRRWRLEREDLFGANQLIHLRPIAGFEACRELLRDNPSVRQLYPAAFAGGPRQPGWLRMLAPSPWMLRLKRGLEPLALRAPGAVLEWCCRRMYGGYLRRQAHGWTSPDEVRLEREVLKLHTESHRREVLRRFEEALRECLEKLPREP